MVNELVACTCNVAHVKVSDIDEVVLELDGREPISQEARERVEQALRFLHMAGWSGYIERQSTPVNTSVDCARFLFKALKSIADIPGAIASELKSYWAAYTTVSVELVNCAKKEGHSISGKKIISDVSDIFSENNDEQLRCDITIGLANMVANFEEYGEWEKLQEALGEMLNHVLTHWLQEMLKVSNYRSKKISKGSASVLDVWYYLTLLYTNEIEHAESPKDKYDEIESLGRQVFDMGPKVLEILECLCKTRGPLHELSCSDRVKDVVYCLRNVLIKIGRENRLHDIKEKAQNIWDNTSRHRVRGHFGVILSCLGNAHEDESPEDSGGPPKGNNDEGGPKHAKK